MKYTIEISKGVINGGESRGTDNIGHTRHRMKTNKGKYTTQKAKKKDEQHMCESMCPSGETCL